MTAGKWKEVRDKYGGIHQTIMEPHSPWQNRAEAEIRELKKATSRIMHSEKVPKRLWDLCLQYVVELRCRTAQGLYTLKGRTPYEVVTGETPDISEWLEFTFYQPCWHLDTNAFPESKRVLSRWLGVSHRVGHPMCFWVLPISGVPISRSTVQAATKDELDSPDTKAKLAEFDQRVAERLARGDNELVVPLNTRVMDVDIFEDDDNLEVEDQCFDMDDAEALDKFISAQVLLPVGDTLQLGEVIKRMRDGHGNLTGTHHPNPLLDTRVYEVVMSDGSVYEVVMSDGSVNEYSANLIAEAMLSRMDEDGLKVDTYEEILNHREIPYSEEKISPKAALTKWKLFIQMRDGTTRWLSLREVRNTYPLMAAEYAVGRSLDKKHAFAWWVPRVLQQKDRIVAGLKSRATKKTHKYG
jgi:hypothetical protein